MDQPRRIITDPQEYQRIADMEPLAIHNDDWSDIVLYKYPEGIVGYYDKRSTRMTLVEW